MTRETVLAMTFIELSDTLVDAFDVVDLLTMLTVRCVEVFDVAAAAIMLATPDDQLRLVSSSSEAMRIVELFELQSLDGPGLDCFRTGRPVVDTDLARGDRWPLFTPVALGAGFRAADAIPMRLRDRTIGALSLFHGTPRSLDDADLGAARAFADVATIAVLQHLATTDAHTVNAQLAGALESRIVIEQAKGLIAGRQGIDLQQAFDQLRHHARSHSEPLADVAARITGGTLAPASLDAARPARRS